MVSANIAYEKYVDPELVEKVLKPAFLKEGYEVTNYHCVGDAQSPEPTLVSIRESAGGRKKKAGLAETLKGLPGVAEEMARGAEKSPGGRAVDLERSCIWLRNPNVIGEYSDDKTAEALFPQVALEYAAAHVDEVLEEVGDKLNAFGKKLADL